MIGALFAQDSVVSAAKHGAGSRKGTRQHPALPSGQAASTANCRPPAPIVLGEIKAKAAKRHDGDLEIDPAFGPLGQPSVIKQPITPD